jgi:hypothetical protein
MGRTISAIFHAGFRLRNPVVTGEIAHIVSSRPGGPRSTYNLSPGEHDKYPNLVLLCPEHHKIIDEHPEIYTVERLRQMKADHEGAVVAALAKASESRAADIGARLHVKETVHSTLLPVLSMPRYVYGAPCSYGDSKEREAITKIVYKPESVEMCPFIIREGGTLFAFNNLRYKGGPFRNLVDADKAQRWDSRTWWEDPDRQRWFVTLLNRALNKLTGRKGLMLDKEHARYYFQPKEPGKQRKVSYRPLNKQSLENRYVVWQPRSKKTGQPRPRWNHLAVGLRFLRVTAEQWCLSIRPEMRVTKDGLVPIEAKRTGSYVTRMKARTFNYDLLGEVNFWRDFLSDGKPRIILSFGSAQLIAISTTLMSAEVEWPGIPKEYARPFTNVEYEEDLFSQAELKQLEDSDEDVEESETDEGEQERGE